MSDVTQVNKAELAKVFGVSMVTTTNWVNRGCPVVQRGNKSIPWVFSLPDVIAWRAEQERLSVTGTNSASDLEDAKFRKMSAEAAIAELNLGERRGELIEIEQVAQSVGEDYSRLRSRLLSIPSKIAPLLVGIESAIEAQTLLDEQLNEVLEELTQDGFYSTEQTEDQATDQVEATTEAAAEA